MKCLDILRVPIKLSRSPRGERGLKSQNVLSPEEERLTSLPSRGAWIEMPRRIVQDRHGAVAPLAGSVD